MKTDAFSLIELLTTLVIIALLAAIALPIYHHVIIKAHRLEAKTSLLVAGTRLEHYYTLNHRYVDAQGNAPTLDELAIPAETPHKNYTLSFSASANAYALFATPNGKQATDDTECGTLMLNQMGEETATGSLGKGCW